MTIEITENPLPFNTLLLSHTWFTPWEKLIYLASAQTQASKHWSVTYLWTQKEWKGIYNYVHLRCCILYLSTSEIMLIFILKCRSWLKWWAYTYAAKIFGSTSIMLRSARNRNLIVVPWRSWQYGYEYLVTFKYLDILSVSFYRLRRNGIATSGIRKLINVPLKNMVTEKKPNKWYT